MSNSSRNMKLNFDEIVVLVLNRKDHKKASKKISISTINIETRGRSLDRNLSKRRTKSIKGKSKSKREKVKVNAEIIERQVIS